MNGNTRSTIGVQKIECYPTGEGNRCQALKAVNHLEVKRGRRRELKCNKDG